MNRLLLKLSSLYTLPCKITLARAGWEWDSPWEVELSPYVDKEGWAYAPDWAAMDWPPQNGAQVRLLCWRQCVRAICNLSTNPMHVSVGAGGF